MKRRWTTARAVASPDGWGVQLDGKPLRLPDGPALLVPQAALAQAVAEEWQEAGAQTGQMDYTDVPLTRLAGTAQLRIVPDKQPTATALAAYAATDLLCYRADQPPALAERQEAAWKPWLHWARTELGAALVVTTGVMPIEQHPAAIAALSRAVRGQSGWTLAGLGIVVPALGSLVLGLAVAMGAISAADAYAASTLDERFETELWGDDAEATRRTAHVAADVADGARFMELVR